MPPEVVIFDVDGTLLDTREYILASFEHAFASLDLVSPSREALLGEIGRPLELIYSERASPALAPLLAELHRSFQTEHFGLAAAYPGVHPVLERLQHAGVVMAAVTSRSARTSLRTLELAGIAGCFAAVVSAEDTRALKPDPAPLRLALERACVPGRPTAMVGDTVHDIVAGRRIGATTVAALYGFGPAGALAAGPDLVIHDIAELPAVLGL